MTPADLAARLGARQEGSGWSARCPAHEDRTASLSINSGHDGRILIHCHANCDLDAILAALNLQKRDLFPEQNGRSAGDKWRIAAEYPYHDEHGALLFQVVRFDPKDFRQRRPDRRGGWIWKLDDTRRVLYRLPDLLGAPPGETVWITEGEKDVESLHAKGLIATTNPQGAGKWSKVDHECIRAALTGRQVIILPDRDEPGEKHAQEVAHAIAGIASSVKVIHLQEGAWKDVSDFFAAGGTVDSLRALAVGTPEWSPESGSEPVDKPAVEVPAEPAKKKAPAIPTFEPFPLAALPGPLCAFVDAAARVIGLDPAFLALPILACVASCIGNTRRIRLKRTWSEPAILWTVNVGASGVRKSPAIDVIAQPIRRRQALAFREGEDAREEYEREKDRFDLDKSRWKKNKGIGEPPATPKEPETARYCVSDTTVEALAPILAANPRGLLLIRDELSAWLGSFDKYSRGHSDVGNWLEFHRAGPLSVDRRGGDRRVLYVPRAAISIVGGVQQGILRHALVPEYFASGLAARLLVTMPPPPPRRWTEEEIAPDIETSYSNLLDRLWSLEPAEADGEQYPAEVILDDEAHKVWVEFFNAHNKEAEGLPENMAAAWAKLEGYCARFALVLHLARWAAGEAIDPARIDYQSMYGATRIARWAGGEAERVYAALRESDEDQERRRLLALVWRQGGRMTPRELTQNSRPYRGKTEAAAAALADLAKHGHGTFEVQTPGPAGGRPTRIFQAFDPGAEGDQEVSTVYETPEVS